MTAPARTAGSEVLPVTWSATGRTGTGGARVCRRPSEASPSTAGDGVAALVAGDGEDAQATHHTAPDAPAVHPGASPSGEDTLLTLDAATPAGKGPRPDAARTGWSQP